MKENKRLEKLIDELGKYQGDAVPGKRHIRDAAVYTLDTLDLAAEIAQSVFTRFEVADVLAVYDRIDRERQRLEGSPAPGTVMILPAKEIEGDG